ncbi:hypothetical protein BN14_09765 [Rhizoctonia solani AG-1 IB]|uniref:Nephrocystin 3-like N-terminal domain-containing protein n=1 Tax=Thanatephorus cucumeris (strain AG1-IB / isolate 7/3/14) TaxID=1108050 RepID=M5CG79_THACB|nr:hypothetical protein BN14_09765 [Rhizoctonia solani AG-1 IB]
MQPLTKAQDSLPTDFIVVIDALDECDNRDTVAQILDVLLSGTSSLPIRYLLSSRPEKEIADRLAGRLAGQDEARLVLHNLNPVDVRSDIEAYMRAELTDISLTDGQWQSIIDRCGSLFIYASTTCRYIKQAHEMETLEIALSVIMSSSSIPMDEGDDNPIDHLYMTILRMAFKPGANQGSKKKIKDILDTVICAMEPMTLSILASVVGLKSGKQVDKLLMPLRSVVNVAKETGLVTTLHASFPDFMLSPNRSGDFYCQPQRRHAIMAGACLGLIDGAQSSFNICALPSSYLLDSEVEDLDMRVSKSIPEDLIYACRHWSAHLDHSEHQIELAKLVGRFFSSRLLLWMEITNLTKHMRHGTSIIQTAENWCGESNAPEELTRLVRDASQFVSVYANHPVSQSTPHIYVSMLPFWPRQQGQRSIDDSSRS